MFRQLLKSLPFLVLFFCWNAEAKSQSEEFQPQRLHYGSDSLQFGELRIPYGDGPFPVIMIIHGGCWLSYYDYTLMDSMAQDLTARGYATWNIEYRRTEDVGGGWPGTLLDVAYAFKHLNELAQQYPIELGKVLVTGHSAGGHLALMLGAQYSLQDDSPLKIDGLPKITGIVSLAGIVDLGTYLSNKGCGSNTINLVGGEPDEFPGRYTEGSPITHLPLGLRQVLITGVQDNIVPLEHIRPYIDRANTADDPIELVTIEEAGHFEVITPGSIAWPEVIEAFSDLLK